MSANQAEQERKKSLIEQVAARGEGVMAYVKSKADLFSNVELATKMFDAKRTFVGGMAMVTIHAGALLGVLGAAKAMEPSTGHVAQVSGAEAWANAAFDCASAVIAIAASPFTGFLSIVVGGVQLARCAIRVSEALGAKEFWEKTPFMPTLKLGVEGAGLVTDALFFGGHAAKKAAQGAVSAGMAWRGMQAMGAAEKIGLGAAAAGFGFKAIGMIVEMSYEGEIGAVITQPTHDQIEAILRQQNLCIQPYPTPQFGFWPEFPCVQRGPEPPHKIFSGEVEAYIRGRHH